MSDAMSAADIEPQGFRGRTHERDLKMVQM